MVEEIVIEWECVLVELRKVNLFLKIFFIVSFIWYSKDGMYGNQISKFILFFVVDELCCCWFDCYYFFFYEIMMDEFCDYCFYVDDMLYFFFVVVFYLWECFIECYFSKEMDRIMKEWEDIWKVLVYKLFNV